MPEKLRMRFSKTGRAIWLSHLDLMRTMQRAFLRAEYPLKYSEGFNPHAQISILLPLSVGISSVCELMDFQLKDDVDLLEIPEKLTAVMPEGIVVHEAYPSETKAKHLKWLEISGRLEYDDRDLSTMLDGISAFYRRPEIIITRKTKRGEGETDIVSAIRELTIALNKESRSITMEALISAQEPTLNPDHLIAALRQLAPELAPDFAAFTRRQVYFENGEVFR